MTGQRCLSPAAARVKRVVRQAVAHLGHIDGAQATVGRGRSTVGRWMNLNDPDLPCLDSALAMDEVLVAMGKGPMLLQALASELGFVAVDVCAGEGCGDFGALLAEKAHRSGTFMGEIASAIADGDFDAEERSLSLTRLDEVIATALRLRAVIAEGAG